MSLFPSEFQRDVGMSVEDVELAKIANSNSNSRSGSNPSEVHNRSSPASSLTAFADSAHPPIAPPSLTTENNSEWSEKALTSPSSSIAASLTLQLGSFRTLKPLGGRDSSNSRKDHSSNVDQCSKVSPRYHPGFLQSPSSSVGRYDDFCTTPSRFSDQSPVDRQDQSEASLTSCIDAIAQMTQPGCRQDSPFCLFEGLADSGEDGLDGRSRGTHQGY